MSEVTLHRLVRILVANETITLNTYAPKLRAKWSIFIRRKMHA